MRLQYLGLGVEGFRSSHCYESTGSTGFICGDWSGALCLGFRDVVEGAGAGITLNPSLDSNFN